MQYVYRIKGETGAYLRNQNTGKRRGMRFVREEYLASVWSSRKTVRNIAAKYEQLGENVMIETCVLVTEDVALDKGIVQERKPQATPLNRPDEDPRWAWKKDRL